MAPKPLCRELERTRKCSLGTSFKDRPLTLAKARYSPAHDHVHRLSAETVYSLSTVWPSCDTEGLLGKRRHERRDIRAVNSWIAENTMVGLDRRREDNREANSTQIANKIIKKANAA